MKHNVPTIIFLVSFFLLSQIIGLFLISYGVEAKQEIGVDGNQITVAFQNDGIDRPEFEHDYGSFVWILFGVLIGTIIILILQKFKKPKIWKYWFFIAVATAISLALDVVLPTMIALSTGLILSFLKIFHRQVIIHNLTEVLMYSGIAVLAAPLFTIIWGVALLLAISIYDMYAVWKSKHMVKMAEFMSESTFAGLIMPYNSKGHKLKGKVNPKKLRSDSKSSSDERVAILGGGDIAFPLIFSGVVLRWLITLDYSKLISFSFALLVSVFAGIALTLLLVKGEDKKFYPAMPFISLGSFIGLGVVYLITYFF